MAKETVLTKLKKGTASFNLIGKAKLGEYTFKIDTESARDDSDWVYNQMNLGIECGNNGVIYADMMGGYGSSRSNFVYVHGKKEEEGRTKDDFKNSFKIDWDDRFDEEILETVGDMCFLTVGLVKGEDGKTIYKKFLSQYDAIKYIKENLEEDTIVNVKGNLEWSDYNEVTQYKKTITSIVLSKAEEKDFRATFTQTILIDSDTIGSYDKETNTIPLMTRIVESISKEYRGQSLIHTDNGKQVKSAMLPLFKTFDFAVGEDKEKAKKMLKVFKVKGKKVTAMTVEGMFSKGEVETTEVTEVDIPDDIKELIELGYVDKDEIVGQIALKNGGGNKKLEKMIITKPHIKYNKVGESMIPAVDKTSDLYEESDVDIKEILKSFGIEEIVEDNNEDNDLDLALNSENDDDDDWLKELDN